MERLFWLGLALASLAAACGSRTQGEYFLEAGVEDAGGSGVGTATGSGGVATTASGSRSVGTSVTAVGVGGVSSAVTTTSVRTQGSAVIGSSTVSGTTGPSLTTVSGSSSSVGGATFGSSSSSVSAAGGMVGAASVSVGGVSSNGAGGTGGFGPCCMASFGMGCADGEVSACVCEFDAYCCNTAWDEICVQEVEYFECGVCNAPFGGFGGFGGTVAVASSMGSLTTSGVSSSVGGAAGSTVAASVGGMGGTGGAPGSCCESSEDPGCEDPSVEACVCEYDSYCCDYSWDFICVDEVEGLNCGVCSDPFGGFGGFTSTTTVSTMTGVGGATSTGSTGEAGGGGVGQCVEQAETQCEECLCTDCFEAYGDCIADFGCPEIIGCLDETGCSGADCVVACQDVIEEFGGLYGASVAYTIALINCAINASCPCD